MLHKNLVPNKNKAKNNSNTINSDGFSMGRAWLSLQTSFLKLHRNASKFLKALSCLLQAVSFEISEKLSSSAFCFFSLLMLKQPLTTQ